MAAIKRIVTSTRHSWKRLTAFTRRPAHATRSFMMRPIVFVVFVLAVVVPARYYDHGRHYTFGHPHLVDFLIVSLLCALAFTHVSVAGIMWLQRRRWLPSERAMFRFISIKSVFWTIFAVDYRFNGYGVTLETIVLFVLLTITTADLDIKLFRRYLMHSDNDEMEQL